MPIDKLSPVVDSEGTLQSTAADAEVNNIVDEIVAEFAKIGLAVRVDKSGKILFDKATALDREQQAFLEESERKLAELLEKHKTAMNPSPDIPGKLVGDVDPTDLDVVVKPGPSGQLD